MLNQNFERFLLFVEDDDDIREIVTRFLMNQGFVVVSASNGRNALDILMLNQHHWYGMVTDFRMPGMDGSQLIKEVLGRGITFGRVIVASSSIEERSVQELLEKGIIEVLAKPCTGKALLKILEG